MDEHGAEIQALRQQAKDLEKNLLTWHEQEMGAMRHRISQLVELYVDPAQRFITRGKPLGAEMLLDSLRQHLLDL